MWARGGLVEGYFQIYYTHHWALVREWVHSVNLHFVNIHLVNFTFGQPYIWSITTFGHFTFRPLYISSIDTIHQLTMA